MFSKQEPSQHPAGQMNGETSPQEWKGLGKHCYTQKHLSVCMLGKLQDKALMSVKPEWIVKTDAAEDRNKLIHHLRCRESINTLCGFSNKMDKLNKIRVLRRVPLYLQLTGNCPSPRHHTELHPWWKQRRLSVWKTQTDACGCSFLCSEASFKRKKNKQTVRWLMTDVPIISGEHQECSLINSYCSNMNCLHDRLHFLWWSVCLCRHGM